MKVLYVCRANIGRSQMAESYHNSLLDGKAESAGTQVNSLLYNLRLYQMEGIENVITAMKEKGIDVSRNKLKSLSRDKVDEADVIIVMAEPETWPSYLKNNTKVEYWRIEDPKGTDLETHKKVRDEIINKIEHMLKE